MIETCACANPTTWSKALYHLLGEEVVCIECNSAHGPRHASAARDRLAAGGRLYLTEEELNPGPPAGATTSADMTEEQKKRQRQLAGLPDLEPVSAEALTPEQRRQQILAGIES